ncbi:nitroreductase family deazaflavin-dependent oxidoreductase [Streptomyces roseoverticillatus]|uniref:nitroreductase/quinone reductase family protein n=1 Tax=Streptomyces roseoverticillatus TaxID=66429 RepID=UPI001F188035|nr:nitroreductase/quinone reductase family protein [Streptomyces roseoverticillatus]MCF3106695.1 nitroreductase family deazaflavin-dependent oxidoreductase [Streptomyces roseoverticillatus]
MSSALSFNQSVIDEFRANGGKVGGPFEGGDLLLLTTTGARSGTEHTTPLGYVRHDGLILVVGSDMGAHRHPDWYLNLLAHPLVQVEIGTERYGAVAVPAEGARRDRLFADVVRAAPGYGDYQANTPRVLPVVVLERTGEDTPAPVRTLADKIMEVHTWLRAQLKHVRDEVDAHFAAAADGERPTPGLGLRIRQHCLAFYQSLEFHHVSEEQHLFPAMETHHPELGGAFERLRAEHRTVARLQRELGALLADIAGADPVRFRAELERMSEELTAHLAYEEEVLLPPLAGILFPPRAPKP